MNDKNEELIIIQKPKEEETVKFILKGRINTSTASFLERKLKTVITDEGVKNFLLNMAQVEYLSSSGIRVILKLYKYVGELGGKFNIEFPSENVKNVLGLIALDKMLIIKSSFNKNSENSENSKNNENSENEQNGNK